MPVQVQQAEFSDFEALRNAIHDAALDIVQLEGGRISGMLTHLSVGSLGISTGSFTRSVRSLGMPSERRWTLGMLLGAPAALQLYETMPGDLVLIQPGQELYSHHPGANSYTAVLVGEDELFTHVESQLAGAADFTIWRQLSAVLVSPPQLRGERVMHFHLLMDLLMQGAGKLTEGAIEFYKRNLLELMTAPILRDAEHRRPPSKPVPRRLVQEIDRFLHAAGNRAVHISELCAHFGVSRRTLHRAFHDVLGIAPITFLRRKRLNDVHTILLGQAALEDPALIKDIAREHGFLEYGRFAGEYRRLFGERPAQTLRRTMGTT